MNKEYYTVEQISEMLDIHPKTIQRYIREGKLRATKVGKGWRISGHELSVFLESNGVPEEGKKVYSVVASSVVDIKTPGKEDVQRIMNTVTAALNAKPANYGQSSMQTQYIERENMVRVTLWGDIRVIATLMDTVATLTQPDEEE